MAETFALNFEGSAMPFLTSLIVCYQKCGQVTIHFIRGTVK